VAGTLNNLGNLQANRNDPEAAMKSYTEALEIRKELASKNPQTYLPDVAITLICMSHYYQHNRIDEEKSVTLALEAIVILQPLFERLPYTQRYYNVAVQVLKDWGMSEEEIEKRIDEWPGASNP
jgi:tetratricopeptide (TPR) repeat protein